MNLQNWKCSVNSCPSWELKFESVPRHSSDHIIHAIATQPLDAREATVLFYTWMRKFSLSGVDKLSDASKLLHQKIFLEHAFCCPTISKSFCHFPSFLSFWAHDLGWASPFVPFANFLLPFPGSVQKNIYFPLLNWASINYPCMVGAIKMILKKFSKYIRQYHFSVKTKSLKPNQSKVSIKSIQNPGGLGESVMSYEAT